MTPAKLGKACMKGAVCRQDKACYHGRFYVKYAGLKISKGFTAQEAWCKALYWYIAQLKGELTDEDYNIGDGEDAYTVHHDRKAGLRNAKGCAT